MRQKLIGLGEKSLRKSYYPQLQASLDDLAESEKKFRQIIESSPMGFYMFALDAGGRLVFKGANPAADHIMGIDHDLLIGRSIEDAFPEMSRTELPSRFRDAAVRGASCMSEHLEYSNGKVDRALEYHAFQMAPEKTAVMFMDITQRKKAEEAQRESEERLKVLFDQAADAIYVCRLDGRLIQVNRQACLSTGYSQDEFLASNVTDFDAEFSSKEKLDKVFGNLAVDAPQTVLSRHTRRDGSTYPVEITVSLLQTPGGMNIMGIARDITERRKAEKEKEKLESELRQAQKMEAVGKLAGGIAHDFNNLLQAINGYAEMMLLEKKENERDFNRLNTIKNAGERAANLVRELLLFSRKADMQRKQLNLNQEIEQAHRILERTIPKMIDIELHLGGGIGAVSADPIQIEQVLLNLGSNAADAMPDGGRLIMESENVFLDEYIAHRHPGVEPGRYVLISVSDTGMGISKDDLEHIFEPFFTTKGIGQGTGLGLASVYGIIKSHGGAISCYSEIGRGTTFKLYLPALETESVNEMPEERAVPPAGKNETILVVDDEEPIRKFAFEALNQFGYNVLTAENGEKALEQYSRLPGEIDLVIMDIGMPGMGGWKCLKEIKQLNPKAKVIISSGYAPDSQLSVDEGGAFGYFRKPYSLIELMKKVREVLDAE